MITNENLTDLDEYLTENHKRNREHDIANLSKISEPGRNFDPLETTEPDNDNVTLDLLAEESKSSNVFAISRTKSKTPIENARREQTSDTSADQGLILLQKVGKKLQCRHCGHRWIFSGKLSRYYTGCPRCHSSIRIKPIQHKSFKGDRT